MRSRTRNPVASTATSTTDVKQNGVAVPPRDGHCFLDRLDPLTACRMTIFFPGLELFATEQLAPPPHSDDTPKALA
jgi:hypothetical protein